MQHYRLWIITLFISCTASAQTPTLSFEDAWVRKMPPHMSVTAAYGTLANHSKKAKKLVGVDARPTFAEAQIHTTINDNGTMRMQQLPFLVVPAKGTIKLQPKQKHFMLMDKQQPVGDTITLLLLWEDGTKTHAVLPVKKAANATDEHKHHN